MTVEHAPQVVHDPLAHAGRQIFFEIAAHGAEDRDHQYREHDEVQNGKLIGADEADDARQPVGHPLRAEDVIENDLQRPWLEQIGDAFAQDSNECECECAPVRIEQVGDANLFLHGSWCQNRER